MYSKDREMILENADNGVITSALVTKLGIHRGVLSKMVENGDIIKTARGIYVIADEWEDEFFTFQQRYQKGIYSKATSLYLHGYSERVPLQFDMTFPLNYHSDSLLKENVSVTRTIDDLYYLGVTTVKTPSGHDVVAYDIEKCLCDMVRGNGSDAQTTLFAMKKYASSKQKDINKLMSYAKKLRVEAKIRSYIELLLK